MNKRQHIGTLQSMYDFIKEIYDEYQMCCLCRVIIVCR